MNAEKKQAPHRFIGLDIHKHFFVVAAMDPDANEILGPQQVPMARLVPWAQRNLTPQDAVVLEMTTNSFQVYDDLLPLVHSVIIVHPPHVDLIVRAQVMTDKIAARALAYLHAKGMLVSIWIPPQEIRDLRAILAQRRKMTRLSTQAKNRLHAVLHRYYLSLPEGDPFDSQRRDWWLALPVSPLERVRIQGDLDTLDFAQDQIAHLEEIITTLAAQDKRVPLLVQLPGVSIIAAMTILAAIGDITRFPADKKLVGYAGFGTKVHESGQRHRHGRITKKGRRDLRAIMVQAAQTAVRIDPHWQDELARLQTRMPRNKAIVAIARKLLVAVWHVLTKGCADRYVQPERLARKFMQHAYRLGKANRPAGLTTAAYVRQKLDALGVGAELTEIPWGNTRTIPLPPSSLDPDASEEPAIPVKPGN
jgi:transposase